MNVKPRAGAGMIAALLALSTVTEVRPQSYVNFEGKQTNPIRVSADGSRLFTVNTPDARVSVFDLSDPAQPSLIAEVHVGVEPVSVNPRSNDEVWVVNEVSDSVVSSRFRAASARCPAPVVTSMRRWTIWPGTSVTRQDRLRL